MSEFSLVPLGQLAEIRMGQSPDSTYVYEESEQGVPFLQGNAEFGVKHPAAKYSCTQPAKIAEQGSSLISVRAPVGETNIADQPYCIGRGLAAVKFHRYGASLGRELLSFSAKSLDKVSQGTTFAAIGGADLRTLLVADIPNQEAKVLETVLDTLDTQIQETEALIAKLEKVKEGLLHDLLTRGIDEKGKLRPSPEQAPELYKASPLGLIPREWVIRPLKEYTSSEITYGIVQAGPHVEGGIPYIRTGDMSGDCLDSSQLLRTSPSIAANYKRSEVSAGDLVVSIRATVGKVLPVPRELAGANLTQGTAKIAPSSKVDCDYLMWAMRSKAVREAIDLEVKGSTFKEITLAALRQVPLAAPANSSEQVQIGKALQDISVVLSKEHSVLEKLKVKKYGLMDDLLTGRVRVTPLLEKAQATTPA